MSRYDGHTFTTFTNKDGLPHNTVWDIFQDREGHLWFTTYGGVSRYDEGVFTTFTTKDGLIHNAVRSIAENEQLSLSNRRL